MSSPVDNAPVALEKKSSSNGDAEAYKVQSENALGAQPSPDDFGFSEAEQKAIIRRVDLRLVLTVGAMYCVSLMDRTNLGAASIAGMQQELKLVGNQYNIISLVFFVTYIVFQPPSTVIVRKIGPRIHLAAITILWGGCMIGMGFSGNWRVMAGLRVVLGVLEAGFFPSCVYLLSTWYTRYDVGVRNSMFYLVGCVAAAFAGILAYGIMHMKGLAGLNGWRWIFVIEGLITIVIGIAGYWLLVDFPDSKRDTWKFLGQRERDWICARVHQDRGDVQVPPFSLKEYFRVGKDWKVWAYALLFFNTTTTTYALAYFLPIILNVNMKFDVATSQCLIAPPYALAGIVMYVTSKIGDKYRLRGPIVAFNMMLVIIGLPIMGFHADPAVRYFGVFLVTAGANSNVPAAMSYQANNIRGQWKRAFCSATFVSFGGIGGIAGSLVFRTEDAPFYKNGLYACIVTSIANLIIVAALSWAFYIENGKAERGEKELEADEEDFQPGFRYTY
ncbi:major facilitator superfamily domain-containing protein [Cercophora newfieldiana]|uniref:Major facilitator superfamily domain-containing protein n=1 Tax=Cercophora newfieldiana TaxID=92897 RepID=A0AA39YB76_9PEZI|nr:major facilitator superfamily domain-containing protein [Cercophora newfieldiana]